uniref:Secreted protein n=1 Tax=Rhizophora mucronata TaxID=61149 RepID=A0A2P2PGH9_RHIMU
MHIQAECCFLVSSLFLLFSGAHELKIMWHCTGTFTHMKIAQGCKLNAWLSLGAKSFIWTFNLMKIMILGSGS